MVINKIKETIRSIVGIPENEIEIGSRLYDDLDLDSLDMSQIIISLENHYSIGISDEEMASFRTVRDIEEAVICKTGICG